MRHPLHSLCPYFAMFPEDFVAKHVFAYTKGGDFVFDPFCGRGTTVFESLLRGRHAGGTDINAVAACVAGAKADPPRLNAILHRIDEFQKTFRSRNPCAIPEGDFFTACFHERTLKQLLFLRRNLNWKSHKTDRFIAAITLGCLHGESHKTKLCLSNRMPRTISTKPEYSVRWWREKGCLPPERDAFNILRKVARFRLSAETAPLTGRVSHRDARSAARSFPSLKGKVDLIVTSPPYLDTTDYAEDQWLRLWFLGGPERPHGNQHTDDRHTSIENYWNFLSEAWEGCAPLVKRGTNIVIRIGGTRLAKGDLLGGLAESLKTGFKDFKVKCLGAGTTTEIKNRQTNVFRPGTASKRYEHDFVFAIG